MLPATADAISCPNCGKRIPYGPAAGGKPLRCQCGSVLTVPSTTPLTAPPIPAFAVEQPPALAPLIRPAIEIEPDELYDLVEDKAPEPVRPPTTLPPHVFEPIVVPGLIDDTECPSCERPMQPGAILCTFCGFNMKTGQKPQRPAAATLSSAATFARLAKSTKPNVVEDKRIEALKLLAPLLALLVAIGLGFAGYSILKKSRGPVRAPLGADVQVLQWIDETGAKEIHDWFKQDPDRIAGSYSTKQALAKADELQSLGAKQVLAFGTRMTRSLAVELPDNPEQRKALFDWESKFAIEHNYHPDKDVGQQYLLLQLN
jgi:hypothetical protein